GQGGVGPPLVRHPYRLVLPLGVAALERTLHRLVAATAVAERPYRVRLRLGGDVPVADPPGERDRLRPEPGDVDGRRLRRPRVDPGTIHRVVAATVGDELAAPQRPDDVDRLLQHLQPYPGGGPHVTEDVLVERLSRADPEHE